MMPLLLTFSSVIHFDVSELETSLFFLPARMGDLAFVTQLNRVMLILILLLLG